MPTSLGLNPVANSIAMTIFLRACVCTYEHGAWRMHMCVRVCVCSVLHNYVIPIMLMVPVLNLEDVRLRMQTFDSNCISLP